MTRQEEPGFTPTLSMPRLLTLEETSQEFPCFTAYALRRMARRHMPFTRFIAGRYYFNQDKFIAYLNAENDGNTDERANTAKVADDEKPVEEEKTESAPSKPCAENASGEACAPTQSAEELIAKYGVQPIDPWEVG